MDHANRARVRCCVVFVIVFFLPRLALAHHGGAEYELNRTVEFKAKLTRVSLINPHSWLYFDVMEKDGKVSHHRCEMRSVHVLRRPVGRQTCFRLASRSPLRLRPIGLIPIRAISKRSCRRTAPVWTGIFNM
jgi:hypothetical protein